MALKVLKLTERVKLQFGEGEDKVIFHLAPLNNAQRIEMQSCQQMKEGEVISDLAKQQDLSLRYSIKLVEGIEYSDGTEFKCVLENDALSDECMSELYTLQMTGSLALACFHFINGGLGHLVNKEESLKGFKILDLPSKKKSVRK